MRFSKDQNYRHSTPSYSFLQSLEWEKFQQSIGRKTWRIDGTLVIRHDLPLGFSYLYCPRPDCSDKSQATSGTFSYGVEKIAREEKSVFLKIDPLNRLPPATCHLQPSHSIQPQETLVIDLSRSESDLLAAMHPKTRYNIRLAERKEVRITNQESRKDSFEVFWALMQETVQRGGFRTHPREYYEKMLAARSEHFSNELFLAEYRGRVLAAALVNFHKNYGGRTSRDAFSGTVTYLHGASSAEYREAMGPHLLHWRIMQEAQRRGFQYYDLWGIDEKKWPGLTRFKKGFGGEIVQYPESVDVIYRPFLYNAYSVSRRIKKQESRITDKQFRNS